MPQFDADAAFDAIDDNHDGVIDRREFRQMHPARYVAKRPLGKSSTPHKASHAPGLSLSGRVATCSPLFAGGRPGEGGEGQNGLK